MKIVVSIPDPVFDAAERLARRLGISRSEFYQRALRYFLESRSHAVIRETLNTVYAVSPEESRLDAAFEFAQGLSVRENAW